MQEAELHMCHSERSEESGGDARTHQIPRCARNDTHTRQIPRFARNDKRKSARLTRRGLTLLEVIISIALIVMVMAALFTFYWQILDVRKQASERANRTQLARQVLAGIEHELRGTVGFDKIGFPVEVPEMKEGDTETQVVS